MAKIKIITEATGKVLRYTNIVHDYPNNRTITDELLHEMYIIVPSS